MRSLFALLLGSSFLLAFGGCDLSSSGSNDPPPEDDGPVVGGPLLVRAEPEDRLLCAGGEVRLIGFNFSEDLTENEVTFISGQTRIPGLPVFVRVAPVGTRQGRDSELRVVVPSGVGTGNLELRVNGITAGSIGYEACPQLMAFTLGRNDNIPILNYSVFLGFDTNASFVKLFGLNFTDLEEVILEDSSGGSTSILPNTIERNVGTGTTSGYQSIGFTLHDMRNNDVRLSLAGQRDNMRVSVRTPAGTSNTLEIPVRVVDSYTDPINYEIGAVISAVHVPTGVRTGPVRIHYGLYDTFVDFSFKMEVAWSVDGGQTFEIARHLDADLESDGATGVLPGMFAPANLLSHPSRHALFPARGTVRTFTWDAQNDPVFAQKNLAGGARASRVWAIHFRLHPIREPAANRIPPPASPETPHYVFTPAMVYNYLEDRPGDDVTAQRAGEIVETFLSRRNMDTKSSRSVLWGPPENEDALSADIPATNPSEFGGGSFQLVIDPVPPDAVEPDTKDQYVEINTDAMTIIRKQVIGDNGTPCDPFDDPPVAGPAAIRLYDFQNPGFDAKEFHLSTLTILPDVKVIARGANPVVFRLRGQAGGKAEDVVCDVGANVLVDLNGCDGDAVPIAGLTGDVPGSGGQGGPGGGSGGDGSGIGQNGVVVYAGNGGSSGGEGGETPLAFDSKSAGASKSPGGPGGGGGHRVAGNPGGISKSHAQFRAARPGRGGPVRGDGKQLIRTGGSGGGGGGLVFMFDGTSTFTWNGGAGGGGGGGVLQIVANGAVDVDPQAKIKANGGRGGEAKQGGTPAGLPGPGGGGSGGTLIIQAAGPVNVPCASMEVFGGLHGTAAQPTNQSAGDGDGGAGWIRLESAVGGVPTCAAFVAETTLTANLAANGKIIEVQSTAGFPDSGTLLIEAETIQYGRLTTTATGGAAFDLLTRQTNPAPPVHNAGASVVLKGSISPPEAGVLAEGKVTASPDAIQPGRGRDGELQLQFVPTVDPATGKPHVDPATGQQLSFWIFDTDKSQILKPDGSVFYETALADSDPGFLELTRLSISPNTVLRAVGSRPLRISVTDQAEIGGWIDVSGVPGSYLRFDPDDPTKPLPGVGGRGGAGGARGGDGGTVEFVNGNPADKSPSNIIPVHGGAGQAPAQTPDGLDQTPGLIGIGTPQDDFVTSPNFKRATPGLSLPAQTCQAACDITAGGGAGGGNLRAGGDGVALQGFDGQGNPIPNPAAAGKGASIFGTEELRFGGDYWLLGGLSGSGGGGNPHVSPDYAQGRIPGNYRFKSSALYAPGTGGGGSGGVVHIFARNLTLHPTARIFARGGDAYQSIDLGGNGGAGSGGTVLIQVQNSLTVEPGALIDVGGGTANLAPPTLAGQAQPEYPGNIRSIGGTLTTVGGSGGNGSPGRIRIEADSRSVAILGGTNSSVSSGPFYLSTVPALAVSRPFRTGVGPSGVAASHAIQIQTPNIQFFEFGQPAGTDSQVLWDGAADSLDQHAGISAFEQGITDPRLLRNREYVRFQVPFRTNVALQRTQTLNEIRLPYRLPSPTD